MVAEGITMSRYPSSVHQFISSFSLVDLYGARLLDVPWGLGIHEDLASRLPSGFVVVRAMVEAGL